MKLTLVIAGILACIASLIDLLWPSIFVVIVEPVAALCVLNAGSLLIIIGAIYQSQYYKRFGRRTERTARSKRAWRQVGAVLAFEGILLLVGGSVLFFWLAYTHHTEIALALLSLGPGCSFIFTGVIIMMAHFEYTY